MTLDPVRPAPAPGRLLLPLLLAALAALPPVPPAVALSCVPPGPLLPLTPGQTVVLAEILQRRQDGALEIQVLEVLQGAGGAMASRTRLRLDARSLSYWSFGRLPFPRGSRWIFHLTPPDRQSHGFDHALSPCLDPPQVVDGVVRGWLMPGPGQERPQAMTVRELRRRIRAEARAPSAQPYPAR